MVQADFLSQMFYIHCNWSFIKNHLIACQVFAVFHNVCWWKYACLLRIDDAKYWQTVLSFTSDILHCANRDVATINIFDVHYAVNFLSFADNFVVIFFIQIEKNIKILCNLLFVSKCYVKLVLNLWSLLPCLKMLTMLW